MPIIKIVSYVPKVYRKSSPQINTHVCLDNGEYELPVGVRYDLFRILINRSRIFFMNPVRYDVFCDEDTYGLIDTIVKSHGPSSITKDDLEQFKTMPLEEILDIAMPKVIADILLEDI